MRPLDLARRWHREGYVTDSGIKALEQRYAGDQETVSPITTVLLAGAGAVLAAAIIAIPFLAEFTDDATRWFMLICGILIGGGAAALWFFVAWKEAIEALSITSAALFVPSAMMFMFEGPETTSLAFLGALVGAAAMAIPSRTAIVATTGLVSMHVLFATAAFEQWGDETGISLWLLVALLAVAVTFITNRLPVWRERHGLVNLLAPMAVGGVSVAWWGEVLQGQLNFDGSGELTVAAIQLPILLFAFYQRNRPVLIGSVFVVAIDAIVFGFDIGELYLGIPMLLVVAGGLVALALWARRDED